MDVAKAAGVPVGNVFYYFKTKDALALAVSEDWRVFLATHLEELEEEDPWRGLTRFIDQARLLRDIYATLGCPLAALARDLKQESDALKQSVARLYETQAEWLRRQFVRAGASISDAAQFTRSLMSALHGSILLAFSLGDPSLIDDETKRLADWLDHRRALLTQPS